MIPLSLSAYQQPKYDRRKNSGIIHNDHKAAETFMKLICIQIDSYLYKKFKWSDLRWLAAYLRFIWLSFNA